MENKSNSKNQPLTIDDIINEIKEKSADGDYIYRGERKSCYEQISSALYRECGEIADLQGFDIRYAQRSILGAAKKHIGEPPHDLFEDHVNKNNPSRNIRLQPKPILEADEIEILTELQHFGSTTNLIDFTKDYFIALFFACSGHPKIDGRVIILAKTDEIENMTIRPYNPRHRVVVQKSVFLYPPQGFIDVPDDKKVTIPFALKQPLLTYLSQYHDISVETIYNDIHGFIINQRIHKIAYIELGLGYRSHWKAYNAESDEERKEYIREAIRHYNISVEEYPEVSTVYHNRGECWMHLKKWDKARNDFMTASTKGFDIIKSFRNSYENVAEFEKETGYEVPKDIAEMLGG